MSTNTNTPVAPDPAKKSKKKRTAIIGVCAVIALVAAGAGIGIHAHRTGTAQAEAEDARQNAYTACQQASDGARASLEAYQKAIADSEDTTKIDPATLADRTTLDTLNTARTSPASKPAACDTNMDEGDARHAHPSVEGRGKRVGQGHGRRDDGRASRHRQPVEEGPR